ncbi:zinc finger protein 62 homolog [Tigriopus californicus]|uniref:zinc finger protein 62 homolog n=1 Tax=Tigriopus californicus TaxID=6832 RepID=UPI0027D9D735|nr:zinc finger protein 62 homolog [Tigriopus californicus]
MALLVQLMDRLQSSEKSLNLLHLVVQNWIVFQRDTFDVFDDYGDPFTTQTFLIEVSTGEYIHRAQGSKVDCGATLDPEILYSKLSEAFLDYKVCHGFPLKAKSGQGTDMFIQEFPYRRRIAKKCRYLFKPDAPHIKSEESDLELRWICSVCQASGNHRDEMIDIPDSDCLMENPVKLEAVLDEDTELFPTQDDECSAEPEADFEFDFEYDEDDDDEKDNISPGTRLARKRKSLQAHTEETIEDKPARKTYSCNHCSETFFTGDAYHRHQRKKRKVGCKECNKDIVTFKQLIEHASKAHPDDAERYIKYGQNPVELQSVKVPKKCSLCDMIFNGNLLLYRHRDVFHELGDYKCATCQVPCLTYYDLVIHNYQKHDQALEHPQPQTFGLEAVSLPDGKVEYKRTSFACQHCSATYTNDSAWTMHMRANHSWDLFECKACDEACHYAADFSAHMVHFHPDKPEIKCPTQGCAYVSDLSQDPDHFNTHYKECRTPRNNYKNFPEKNLFQCDTCGKKYFSKTSFECHIKQHQGIERYKCSHCDYGTNTKTVLIDHEKSHLRDKGLTNADTNLVLYHRCDQCGKEFSQKQSLRDHIKSIHLGIKKLRECKDCGQIFKSQSVLYIHKRKMHGFVNTQPLNRGGRKKKKIEPEQK